MNVYVPNPKDEKLSSREKSILRSIIHLYILNGAPVGSGSLSKYLEKDLRLSSATIRNIMADLEDMEYISHPHTSAGRIPTDKGYRVYVDSLMDAQLLSEPEKQVVMNNLVTEPAETMLKDASRVLGMISKYLGVVEIPHLTDLIVQKIELIPLSSTRLLVVVALESSIVRTVTLEANFGIDNNKLDQITTYINDRIGGRQLGFLRENFNYLIGDLPETEAPLMRLFIDSVDKLFESYKSTDRIHIAGTRNLLVSPDYEDLLKVRGVIELIEDEDIIIHLLDKSESNEGDIKIIIGKEMQNEILNDYSLVVTKYLIGSAHGSIGLIGPKRMNYSKMISLVQFVSEMISKEKGF
jgi:heat-inducible transcriptional repressor